MVHIKNLENLKTWEQEENPPVLNLNWSLKIPFVHVSSYKSGFSNRFDIEREYNR